MTPSIGSTGREIQLVRYPQGAVRPSDFRTITVDIAEPREGEVLVRNTWMSIDPGLRLRLRPESPIGYWPAQALGETLGGALAVGEVVASRAEGFRPGDIVSHASGWREYAVVRADQVALGGIGTLRRLDTTCAPARAYLGVLGGTGLTAYAGIARLAELRAGEVVWVSAAAGAVGSLAAQIAKLREARVIGSAGSDAKVASLLRDVGLDGAFNHRSAPVRDLLAEAAPEGIDVYFDNVGGGHLAAALEVLRPRGRVVLCGMISTYEDARSPSDSPDLLLAVTKELSLRGLRGSAHVDLLPELWREVGAWLREGRLVDRETVVDGLENAPLALARLMRGETEGKTLVRIAEE